MMAIAYVAIAITLGATPASSQGWLFATLFAIVTVRPIIASSKI